MNKIKTFFCYLSGELPSKGLPAHEVIAILKSVNIEIKKIQLYDQVLLISSDTDICKAITSRAAYVHRCGELLLNISGVAFNLIEKKIRQIDFNKILSNKSSFAVRIKKIKDYFPNLLEEELARKVGHVIQTNLRKKIGVNLTNPDILFFGIFTENNFIFGINLHNTKRFELRQRAPHTRPFFHPCGLDPFLARAMVNLSEINRTGILYDPFCGSGSILIEAAFMGVRIIGSDINHAMIRGTSLNLKAQNIQDFNLLRADARKLCLHKISYLVTDPPYGRASSIFAKNLENLLLDFFGNTTDIIEKDSLCIIALPSTFKIDELVSSYNFKIQHEFEYYVHSSLSRIILVLKKQ